MQYTFSEKQIGEGLGFCVVKAAGFKTACVSLNISVPLSERASEFALVPNMLTRSSEDYPDVTALETKLANLYGAQLGCDVIKSGENQILKISVSCIDDRFSLDGKPIVSGCCDLLLSLLFKPHTENGVFFSDETESEKRLLLEQYGAEMSDKRSYAKTRCEEIMCENEPYGIYRLGTREGIHTVTPESLTEAYRYLLKSARITLCVSVNENTDYQAAFDLFKSAVSAIDRDFIERETLFVESAEDVTESREEEPVKQGKLVLGFRAGMSSPDDNYAAKRVMVDLFGGSPHSKLFTVVREKMSLCYYCSARLLRQKGIIFVQSGIETYNEQKAKDGILEQLEAIKHGEFTDDELSASIKALEDSFKSVSDSPEALESWFTSQLDDDKRLYPDDYINMFRGVTREEIIEAANSVTLDTVFMLAGTLEEEAE